MPRLSQSVPRYRKHKASGQAFVELSGRRHYLGPHGSRTSRDEYDRLIGEWLQNGRATKSATTESGCLLVVELIAAYLNFAKSYYRKSGQLTSEYAAILHAVLPLKQLYGRNRVSEFGPIALQTVMARMVANGWARHHGQQAGRTHQTDVQMGRLARDHSRVNLSCAHDRKWPSQRADRGARN